MPSTAEAAKAFNKQLRATAVALGASPEDEFPYAFVCECGCDEVAKLTLADYDAQRGARLAGHQTT